MQFSKVAILLFFSTLQCLCMSEKNGDNSNKKCQHITALIPARAGSKGIKNKNLSILGNQTLLARTLTTVQETHSFDSVWVLTDGDPIAQEATKYGAQIHWRDPLTATDNASTVSAIEDFLLKHSGNEIVAVIQVTSPFLKKDFLSQALDIMTTNNSDCVFSVTRSHQLRWTENKDGFATPINFNPRNRPRRQDWQGELIENGMFYFAKSTLILNNKALQNDRCKTVEVPKEYSLEIDTEFDLELARLLLPKITQKL